jgi:hypothetical protein
MLFPSSPDLLSILSFTDRSFRMAGLHHSEEAFPKLWSAGPVSFFRQRPTASLSILEPGRPVLIQGVLAWSSPRLNGNDLLDDRQTKEGVACSLG